MPALACALQGPLVVVQSSLQGVRGGQGGGSGHMEASVGCCSSGIDKMWQWYGP